MLFCHFEMRSERDAGARKDVVRVNFFHVRIRILGMDLFREIGRYGWRNGHIKRNNFFLRDYFKREMVGAAAQPCHESALRFQPANGGEQ